MHRKKSCIKKTGGNGKQRGDEGLQSGMYACNREEGHRVTLYARAAASRATKRFTDEDLATMLDSIKERVRKCGCAFKALSLGPQGRLLLWFLLVLEGVAMRARVRRTLDQ